MPPLSNRAELAVAPETLGPRRGYETLKLLLRNRLALVALIYLIVLVALAVFNEALVPYSPTDIDVPTRLSPPTWSHPFGTDELGRDVLSRVIVAGRVSLQVGLIAVSIALVAGVTTGLIAGFYGRAADAVLMRVADILFTFPAILLALAILSVLGPGIGNAMIAIGIVYTPIFARITRGSVLSVRELDFVRAARSIGTSNLGIMWRHILPNVAAPILVQTSLSFAFAILSEAALSFLGVGVQPPNPAWGLMLAESRTFVRDAPWMGIFPGLAIFTTILAFNFLGDGLRDVLDPRQKSALESQKLVAQG